MVREDLLIKKQRENRLRNKIIRDVDYQYKRVIDELRKQLNWWQNNAWKATFLSGYNRAKSLFERR